MLLRDRLLARLAEMGAAPDHQRLAAEVLGIRNAPPDLARRLVAQALVVEDRRDAWRRAGERICARCAGDAGRLRAARRDRRGLLYVGKAINLRRRLRAHFAERRWRGLKAPFARVAGAEWHEVGFGARGAAARSGADSRSCGRSVNVQIGRPSLETRAIPAALVRDVIVVVPSVEPASAELVAARADGGWLIQRTPRDGSRPEVHTRRC